MQQLKHFVFPPSLKCRLSIVKRELRQALENEHEKINDKLIDRCIEVGVGAVGTSSPIDLIGVAYNLYKQQFATSGAERERAGKKHFAMKFLDASMGNADRVFCYVMYKIPTGTPTSTKRIREVVEETKCDNFEEWRERAYGKFSIIRAPELAIKIVLQDLYIGSLRSIMHEDYRLLREKDIDCIVVYSEFIDYGFNINTAIPMFGSDRMIVVSNPSVQSLPIDLFAKIHRWRCKDYRVCVACDTDGLTVSGLLVARYLSLVTRCTYQEAIKALKISHESFMPMPNALNEFLELADEEEEAEQLEMQIPSTNSMKNFDRRMIDNCIRVYRESK